MRTADTITIRRAGASDRPALDRLAGRDSQHLPSDVPSDEFLIAEVGGELWAAVGMSTGVLVADPFVERWHGRAPHCSFLRRPRTVSTPEAA